MLFRHNFFEFEDLKTDESTGERHYLLPDGSAVPSVTTVLSKLSKAGIDAWKQRVGEEEAKRISTKAALRGTAIHKICEAFLLNDPNYIKGQMPTDKETFRKLQPYLEQCIGTIYGLEIPLFSKVLNTAGRTDCIAEYKGKMSVVDFKTSRKPKREEWIENYFIQATCYALMAEAMFRVDIPQIVVMICVDNEDPQIFRRKKDKYIERVNQVFIHERN